MFRHIGLISSKFLASRQGHVAILTGLAAPALIASVGLGVEAGLWFYQQRLAQKSADIAAYAGAVEARSGGQADTIDTVVIEEAGRNGYDPARGPIAVNWPPLSGNNINERSVEVIIEQTHPRLLSSLFMDKDLTLTVRSVGSYEEPGPACILSLDPTASGSMIFTGSSSATLTNCDLMANSLASDAMQVTSTGTVSVSCANSAGGIVYDASLQLMDCPEPRTNLPPALDPYANLTPPTQPSGCQTVPGGAGTRTIGPGHYCNGMNLNGNVVLEPGVYYVSGGSFKTNGNSNVYGEGVTIYLTGDADIQMNGNADVNLSAPSSGPYAGLLFWGDKNNLADTSAIFNGTASSSLKGSLYFPNQTIDMNGDFAGSAGCTRIIARFVDISGNTGFDSNCSEAGVITVNVPGVVRLME